MAGFKGKYDSFQIGWNAGNNQNSVHKKEENMKKMVLLLTALIFAAACYASELIQLPAAHVIYDSLNTKLVNCERFLRKSGLHKELGMRTLSSDAILEVVERSMYDHMSRKELNSGNAETFKFRLLKGIIESGRSEA